MSPGSDSGYALDASLRHLAEGTLLKPFYVGYALEASLCRLAAPGTLAATGMRRGFSKFEEHCRLTR